MTDASIAPPVSPPPLAPPAPPKSRVVRVTTMDLVLIMAIAAMALAVLVAFGWFLRVQGFIAFPDVSAPQIRGDSARYFQDALDYRERRLTLALILRTFTTGFAFVVGLALCTQGGIFILRQVTAFTEIRARGGAAADTKTAPLFSFASYSPGVVFLLGGVGVMMATQYLAIPVKSIEIVPPGALQMCLNDDGTKWISCINGGSDRAVTPPAKPDVSGDNCSTSEGILVCKGSR